MNNPFRFVFGHGRLAIHAIAFVCATGLVIALNAGSLRADPEAAIDSDVRSALASNQMKRSLHRYAERLTKLARTAADDDLLDDAVPRSLRKRNIRPFVIEAAVGDGKLVLARTTRSISFLEVVVRLGALPIEVIERDIATGTERLIFKSRSASVGGLRTRAGTTAFGTGKITVGRRSVSYGSSLLVARPGSNGAAVVSSDSIRVEIDGFAYCGSILSSAILDQTGAVLFSRGTGTCSLVNEVKTERRIINPDGSERPASFAAGSPPFEDPALALENGRLLSSDFESSSVGISDEQGADFSPLVDGTVQAASLAADGSVAAVIGNDVRAFPNQSEYPSPFVVFPQGGPNRMVVASRMAGKVRHLRFCAENLYAIKRISNFSRMIEFPTTGISFGWMNRDRAAYRVLLYDRNGALIRSLGDTPKMVLSAVGCQNGALNLVATRGKNATLLRYAP